MAKKFFSLLLVQLCMASVYANLCSTSNILLDDIMFFTSYDGPTSEHGTIPKTPIVPPSVSIDDHILYFNTPCDGCTLNIVGSNNVLVYTLVIPTGITSLVLPATLSGEYELQIISGNYIFYGTIDLP